MNSEFWHEVWNKKEIGFHKDKPHKMLVNFFHELNLKEKSRIFVPLCGKTLDIGWLLSSGYSVVGVELSESAIIDLFNELNLKATITKRDHLKKFSSERIDIYCGDFFDLPSFCIDEVDAIYDRAAMVALPHEMRARYTRHLRLITHNAPLFLITFEYPDGALKGPPFSISSKEIENHYKEKYTVSLKQKVSMQGRLKDFKNAFECVWMLRS